MRKLFTLLAAVVLLCGQLAAQTNRTITGKVTDDKGSPLAGVTVTAVGSDRRAQTDDAGNFSISIPEKVKSLRFSYVGFVLQDVSLGSKTTVAVKLNTDDPSLAEVVVVGYGTQQKKSFTGAASKIDAKKFSNLMTPSVDKQLAGRAPGVQVTNTSGIINAPARIRIRGTNSLNQSNDPLIVVDGIPILSGNLAATTNSNAIGDINPADIENIEVLKDGSATAIYGSRAAAGVIMITTKKGTKGSMKMNYDAFVGFNNVAESWDLLNAQEFVAISNEKLANAALAPRAFMDAAGTNTNWLNEVLVDNALVHNHTLSFQGGTNKTTYYMSLNFSDQQGSIISNWNKAYRVRLNLEHEANKFIKIGNNITLSRQEDTDQNTGSNSLGGAIASALRLLPNVSPYSTTHPSGFNIRQPAANAMENGPNLQGVDDNYFNVAFVLANNKYYSDKYRIINNAFAEISPLRGLKFRSQFGLDMLADYSYQAWDPRHGDGYSGNGLVYNANQNFFRSVFQNYFNYNKSIKGHSFFLTAGHEVQYTRTKWFSATGTNISDLFFIKEGLISGSAAVQTVGGSYSQAGFESYFGRINYDFNNKYFLQASVRRDGQSSLAPGKKYGTFPGFSAGWRPSEEKFWKNNPFLGRWFTDVKLKASYATVGNTLGGLPYLSTFGAANYGNVSGIAVNNIGNADLQWETSKKYDVGIDVVMRQGKYTLSVDYFLNDVDNLVFAVPTPLSAGIPGNSIQQNIATLQNKGIEFAASATLVNNKNFNWVIDANATFVKNEIKSLYDINGVQTPFVTNGSYNLIRVGDPMNIIYGYQYAGVNTANGNPMYYKADGKLVQHNIANNTFYFASGKDDASLLPANATTMAFADRVKLGEGIPTWFGAVTNSFAYKNFSLEVMLRYSGGNQIMNTTRQEALLSQSFHNNGREILERWTTPGQVTDVPRVRFQQGNLINQNGLAISRFVESGDYLRLQNVVLSYNFDRAKLQKWTNGYIQNVRLYAQGQNLFVWTKYTGADPDNISTGGVDASVAPQIRTISFGLNLGF
jgi:TonB-dependent starch-binding outer membrane protein SusC